MPPMSGRSWRGFAQPSPSWPSDSLSKNSTCFLRLQLPHWSAVQSHCQVSDSATGPGWHLSFLALPSLQSLRSVFCSPRRTSTAKSYTRAPDRGLMWRLPFYSYLSAVLYSFTYLMRLSPRNKDDDDKLFQQDTSPLA